MAVKNQIDLKSKTRAILLTFSILPLISNAYLSPVNLSAVASFSGELKTINVSIDQLEKVSFTTSKDTLKEALLDQGIETSSEDLVEPNVDTSLKPGISEVSIKKASPVTVIDKGQTIIGKSAHLSASEILKDLSISLYAADDVRVANPLDELVPGLKIYIDRANTVNLQVDSNLREIHTRLSTVADLLYAENITLGAKDKIEPGLETNIKDGLVVKVIRVLENENAEVVDIPFSIQYKDDPNILIGQTKVENPGETGKKEITFRKVLENGKEVSREILQEKIIKEPVPRIILKGTKPKFSVASGSYADWINDAASKYGVDASRMSRMMYCESGGNANSVGGGGRFYGLFQYLPSTWAGASAGAGYTGASIFDPKAQIYTTAWKISVSGYGAWPICGYK